MRRWIIICLAVAGCNTPGPQFRGLPATRVTVEGSVFDVRLRGDMAEAMRVNMEFAPRFGPIRDKAAVAMARVSGCGVREVRGDQALATGTLDCDGGAGGSAKVPPSAAPPPPGNAALAGSAGSVLVLHGRNPP